jgi:SMC interacting uncharacterized protein involved in chromosome segregation
MADTPAHVISPVVTPQPTTTSTTTVNLPATPTAPRSYENWSDVLFILGGIVGVLFVIKEAMGFASSIGDFIDRKKRRDKELDAPLEARIIELEELSKTFRPRDDLQRDFSGLAQDIAHLKNNRQTAEDALNIRLQRVEGQAVEDRLERARLETKVDAMVKDFTRVEGAVDRLAGRMEDRLDKIQQMFTENRHTTTPQG